MLITLGNVAPIEVHHHDPDNPDHKVRAKVSGGSLVTRGHNPETKKAIQDLVVELNPVDAHTTEVKTPAEWTAVEIVASVAGISPASTSHAWAYHSAAAPGWVLCAAEDGDVANAELVKAMLEDIWGIAQPAGATALVTYAGLDYASKQLGGAASATAIAVNMALTANATAPAAGDTTLTAEITTAGGGLLRAACAYAHTASATTYTLTKTFTANGSDALPVTVNKMGIFDATPSGGNMPFETAISPAITFNASGDAGTITETVTV